MKSRYFDIQVAPRCSLVSVRSAAGGWVRSKLVKKRSSLDASCLKVRCILARRFTGAWAIALSRPYQRFGRGIGAALAGIGTSGFNSV